MKTRSQSAKENLLQKHKIKECTVKLSAIPLENGENVVSSKYLEEQQRIPSMSKFNAEIQAKSQ